LPKNSLKREKSLFLFTLLCVATPNLLLKKAANLHFDFTPPPRGSKTGQMAGKNPIFRPFLPKNSLKRGQKASFLNTFLCVATPNLLLKKVANLHFDFTPPPRGSKTGQMAGKNPIFRPFLPKNSLKRGQKSLFFWTHFCL
jgi:hypothetical protein